jgi:nucleoside-diphosphate-sugar epimerase
VSRILIVGGTRFVGLRVAEALAERHDVTVMSRNPRPIANTTRVVGDRREGLAALRGQTFDAVIDFIAYDGADVAEAAGLGTAYLAISSSWVPRLNGAAADARPADTDALAPASMSAITRRYLLGKSRMERAVAALRESRAAAAIRLPILMGAGDHTARADFYRSRLTDGGPVALVDGGRNVAQIVWADDAAHGLQALVEGSGIAARGLWEALPDDGVTVKAFVDLLAGALGVSPPLVDVPVETLREHLPGYLDDEPLWREIALVRSPSNLFLHLGITPTPATDWVHALPPSAVLGRRPGETELLQGLL